MSEWQDEPDWKTVAGSLQEMLDVCQAKRDDLREKLTGTLKVLRMFRKASHLSALNDADREADDWIGKYAADAAGGDEDK